MNTDDFIKYIIHKLCVLEAEVHILSENGKNDLSKSCELFFAKILNIIYDLNLIDVNLYFKKANYPGIDIGDLEHKIAYQITIRGDNEKVIGTFINANKNKIFKKSLDFLNE